MRDNRGARWIHRRRNIRCRRLSERGLALLREGRRRYGHGESLIAVTRWLSLRSDESCFVEE